MALLKDAIAVHQRWKEALRASIAGGVLPDRAEATATDRCELGRWLEGAGAAEHGALDAFNAARKAHARFHQEVGRVLALIEAGHANAARTEMKAGAFAAASTELRLSLAVLQGMLAER